jgi:tRNA 2-thiocytidine biosynthesis protein TtcA
MFTALSNVIPSHLMDRKLYPFETIKATGKPMAGGDIAFDEDDSCGDRKPAGDGLPAQATVSLSSLRIRKAD